MYLYVFCVNSALQVGHQISLGKTYIFSTSRPPPLGTSLHSQALVFPVFVWLSIIAASTSGIVFSSELGTPAKSATSFYCDGFLTRLYCHALSLRSMAHSISSWASREVTVANSLAIFFCLLLSTRVLGVALLFYLGHRLVWISRFCRFLTQVCLFTLWFTKPWHAIISMGGVWCIQRVTLPCFVGLLPLIKVPHASSHKLFDEGVQTKNTNCWNCFIHPCCHIWPLQVHHWVVTIACVLALFAPQAILLNRKWATESQVFELISMMPFRFHNGNCFAFCLCSGVWPFHRWHLRTGPAKNILSSIDYPPASPCPKNVILLKLNQFGFIQ